MVRSCRSDAFLRFDVVDDYSDHHYVKKDVGNSFTDCSTSVNKRIMSEWKILKKSLPESITVHVYEQRIDLMRALIVGAAGTPYHDALFLFDINFPIQYPHQPPEVFYQSFGYRLNPNLYENGKVCLSLLNTWPGRKNEQWNATKSTVLQLLLSIQALVLNEKPYYNEPGNGGWLGKTLLGSQARSYNEDAFVMSCKTSLCLLRNPPKGFESFMIQHFRDCGKTILEACSAYANGLIPIGYYNQNGDSTDIRIKVSDKFKASMTTLYPLLLGAFARIGAQLGDCHKQLAVEMREPALLKSPPKAQGRFLAIKTKVIGKFKKIFGIKNKKSK